MCLCSSVVLLYLQKSSELTAAQQDKANLKDQYRKEILNLQQDLRTAYKQHQKEVTLQHPSSFTTLDTN